MIGSSLRIIQFRRSSLIKYHRCISTIDLHAGGEPARVVLDGGSLGIHSSTGMAEKRFALMSNYDHIRKILLLEPRGYPCQNANIVFPSKISSSGYGFVIMEQNRIYPMMSGQFAIWFTVYLSFIMNAIAIL